MLKSRGGMFTLEACFGVTLNGEKAHMDTLPSGRIVVKSKSDRAVFNPSVASAVCQKHKGNFVTLEKR